MPYVNCPECERSIGVTAEEIAASLTLECAECGERFPAAPAPRVNRRRAIERDPHPPAAYAHGPPWFHSPFKVFGLLVGAMLTATLISWTADQVVLELRLHAAKQEIRREFDHAIKQGAP